MAYCSTDDLKYLTGRTDLDTSTVLSAIIASADRQVDAYLTRAGATGASGGECQEASIAFSKALILERGLQAGEYQSSNPEFTSSVNVTQAATALRNAAYALLDSYIDRTTTTAETASEGVERADSHMDDLKMCQGDLPEYFDTDAVEEYE